MIKYNWSISTWHSTLKSWLFLSGSADRCRDFLSALRNRWIWNSGSLQEGNVGLEDVLLPKSWLVMAISKTRSALCFSPLLDLIGAERDVCLIQDSNTALIPIFSRSWYKSMKEKMLHLEW
jgi:hypothetical protein